MARIEGYRATNQSPKILRAIKGCCVIDRWRGFHVDGGERFARPEEAKLGGVFGDSQCARCLREGESLVVTEDEYGRVLGWQLVEGRFYIVPAADRAR